MFGYVMVNKSSLSEEDFEIYQSYYCGLCHTLKQRHGHFGRLTLTYDMTFLALVLTSLYEAGTTSDARRCAVHPGRRHNMFHNIYIDYAADMNIALTYYNLLDNWQDDHSIAGLSGSRLLHKSMEKISSSCRRQTDAITEGLKKLQAIEQANTSSLDAAANCFGELTGELFIYKPDIWSDTLRRMGFYLGKFVYLMDACDDLERDQKHHNYNPLLFLCHDADYEARMKQLLTSLMADCAREFEKLPVLRDAGIIRNILYSGVWCRYNSMLEGKAKKERDKKS